MKYFAKSRLSDNIIETPEGFLLCLGVPVARVGEQKYAKDEVPIEPGEDGMITVIREPEDVFAPEAIASFEGKTFTITHPEEFVGPENFQELAHGHAQNLRRGEGEFKDDLLADILITTKEAISLVRNGTREISCGYECDYIELEPGKGKQSKIRGNHIALVDEGRAGPKYAIKDHKGVNTMKTAAEKKKFLDGFKKFFEDAFGAVEEPTTPLKVTKTGDESAAEIPGMDALMQKMDKLCDALMPKPKVEEDAVEQEGEVEAAGDEEVEAGLEGRLKKLEAMVAKILEAKSDESSVIEDEDPDEETADGDMDEEEGEEANDAAVRSNAEIISPGIQMVKDEKVLKVNALKKCYATKEGKKLIHSLTGDQAPAFKSQAAVNMLFNATAELMKSSRGDQLASTKRATDHQKIFTEGSVMTPEKINEINAKRYGNH